MSAARRKERGPEGQAPGTVATEPGEVDSIATKIYNAIFKGNVTDQAAKAKRYMEKYSQYIFKAEEASMEALTGKDLQNVVVAGAESACGMDQWTPAELKLLSPLAFEWLASFLNEVEKVNRGRKSSTTVVQLSS